MIQSLDRTRTGKSISIALAFALRACVRAKLRVRDASAVAGRGLVTWWKNMGPPPPSIRALVAVAKPLPCFMLVSCLLVSQLVTFPLLHFTPPGPCRPVCLSVS